MRTRLALSILLTSASVMISGLAIRFAAPAVAQERPDVSPADEEEPRQPRRPIPPGARVQFNLEDANLSELVALISDITGRRFIVPANARKIQSTIRSPREVTAAEAYRAFLSILTLNGLALEPAGQYLKVVESGNLQQKVLPVFTDDQATPSDDRYLTQLHRLDHISAEDAATLLNTFKSEAGNITVHAPTNLLIVTDTGRNIRRMMRILGEVDIARTGEQIWVEPVHYAPATEIAELLTQVFPSEPAEGQAGPQAAQAAQARARRARAPQTRQQAQEQAAEPQVAGASRGSESRITSIIPDERGNQLIIVATERAYLRILELLRVLDVPVEGEGGVHIYNLQYADSETMAETLQSLVEGGQSGGGRGGSGNDPSAAARRAAAAAAAAAQGGSAVTGALTGEVGIQAHKATNSLLITASLQDYASLRRVIDQLDQVPRQVFIEAVIMELVIDRNTDLGLSYHGGAEEPSLDGNAGATLFGFNATGSIGLSNPVGLLAGDTLSALAVGVRGPNIPGLTGVNIPSFGVLVNALARASDADVLATPHLLAMDNTEAEINVGENVPLQTSNVAFGGGGLSSLSGLLGSAAGTSGASGLAGLAGLAGGLGGVGGGVGGRQNVGTIIRLTPHINDSGEIRLEIEEEISQAGAPAAGNLGVIPIIQRIAKTQVLVRDQQTVVIGGLMQDRITNQETKIPILGDIPILGALFRRTTRTTKKTNLLLFLTPYVIRTPEDLRSIYERKMRERQEFIDRYFVFGDHEYTPPLDFSRTRGLLSEMFNELAVIDEEIQLAEDLRSRPPPEHTSRRPLGAAEPFDAEAAGDLGEDVLVIEPEEADLDVEPAEEALEPEPQE